ncbi:MAG: adenylate/guanylate cyclase domain-containing protein [Betaproteobacteria bacterium]
MFRFNRSGTAYVIIVVAILAVAWLVRLADPFFVQALRLIAFDSYQLLGPAEYDSRLPVRVVDIDDESIRKIGQWPWSRTTIADLLQKLTDQGAAVVTFDMFFSEADRTSPEQALKLMAPEDAAVFQHLIDGKPTHDEILAKTIAATPTVLATALTPEASPPPPVKGGIAIAGDDPRPYLKAFGGAVANLPAFDDAAKGIGSINWVPDRDQVLRRVPLFFRVGDQIVPTLPMEALRVAFGGGTYVLKGSNSNMEQAFGSNRGLNNVRVGAIEIPTDNDGAIWLKFRHATSANRVPAWKVLAGTDDPSEVAGMISLVGTSAPGLLDLRATPLDANLPGFDVHAQILEHIIRGGSLVRPDFARGLELAIMVLLGLGLAAVMPRLAALYSASLGVAVIALMLYGGWIAYSQFGLLLDPSFPALVLFVLVTTATIYVYRRAEQQRGEVRRAFGYYVAPAVVNEIIAHPDKLELGGVVRPLTLLFCDVRNFTSISERMTAHELTTFINNLLTPLSEVILENRGTIDKYMGDAIMAFWNAPLDDPEHAEHALRSALAMIKRMEGLNEVWRKEAEAAGRVHARVAIGINSGDCCVGNLGSVQRFDYSAIGDDVNVASRFEGLSKVYGVPIVLGEPTVERIPGLRTVELDIMRVKGRAKPTRIYTAADALGLDEAVHATLAEKHATMLDAYRGRNWEGAEGGIAECEGLGIKGLAALYAVYRHRIAEWRAAPPPADWDGTFTATSK